MSEYIAVALRGIVTRRAFSRCEYCGLHQTFSTYTHEIDHIVALKHGGQTAEDNLVLACFPCNRHKGSDLTSLDPQTSEITPLFNPRSQYWHEHFSCCRGYIVGVTSIGRTTVFLLQMNKDSRVQTRIMLAAQGINPTQSY